MPERARASKSEQEKGKLATILHCLVHLYYRGSDLCCCFGGKRTHQELVGKSNRKVARDVGEQAKIIEIGELEHAHHFRVPVQTKINTEKKSLINT